MNERKTKKPLGRETTFKFTRMEEIWRSLLLEGRMMHMKKKHKKKKKKKKNKKTRRSNKRKK